MPDSVLQPAPVSTTRRLALRMKSASIGRFIWSAAAALHMSLRRERVFDLRPRGNIHQRVDQHAGSAVEVGDGDLFVGVVSGIGLAGEPHTEGDGVRESLGVRTA